MQRTPLAPDEHARVARVLEALGAQMAGEAATIAAAYGPRSTGARLARRLARDLRTLRRVLDEDLRRGSRGSGPAAADLVGAAPNEASPSSRPCDDERDGPSDATNPPALP